jgi:hypothetical protein
MPRPRRDARARAAGASHGVFTYAVIEGLKGWRRFLEDKLIEAQELST